MSDEMPGETDARTYARNLLLWWDPRLTAMARTLHVEAESSWRELLMSELSRHPQAVLPHVSELALEAAGRDHERAKAFRTLAAAAELVLGTAFINGTTTAEQPDGTTRQNEGPSS